MAFVRQTRMGAGADEVRAYRQPQDRQGARSRRAALTAWTSRQGERIEMPFAAAHEFVQARNGHAVAVALCPFLGVKRASFRDVERSAYDPERTLALARQ